MTERTRRLLLAIATLPGIAFPFLDFCCWNIRPYDVFLSSGGSFDWSSVTARLYVSVMFAPLVMTLLDASRLRGSVESRIVAWFVAGYAVLPWLPWLLFWLARLAGVGSDSDEATPTLSDYIGIFVPSALCAIVIEACWRFGRRLAPCAEVALMMGYIGVLGSFVWDRLDSLAIGGDVGLFVCFVFVIRIADVLLQERKRGRAFRDGVTSIRLTGAS